MFADQDQHRHFHLCKFGPEIERGQRIAGGAKHLRIGPEERFAAIGHQVRMLP